MKKASVRDSYKADPEMKKASVRDSYKADSESKRSAKRWRYEEDPKENLVSSPDPDSQQLRVDFITATWKVGLGNKNDALVPSVPKHWDGCVHT